MGNRSSLFAKGFAAHSAYGTYTDLDETDFGGSAGVVVSLSNMVTGRVALVGKLKRFGDSNRDSTSFGADAGLKERLTPQFWLNESVAYEKNDADSAFFTYTGYSIDVDAGYSPVKATTLMIGGRYLVETYDQPSGATIDTTTVYVGINHELAKTWALSGEYDLELSKLSYTGTSDTNNVLSVAIRYYY